MIIAPRGHRRRLAVLSVLVAATLVVACDGVVADFRDLVALSGELSARYTAPAHVNVHNGTHMTIVFQNAPVAKLDSAGRAAFAREVAEFARTTYPRAGELTEIRVEFSETGGVGPVRVTHTEAPYAWTIAELAPAAVARDMPVPASDAPDERVLVLPGGQRWDTRLRGVRSHGQLPTDSGAPYYVLSGWECEDCDATEGVYIESPARPRTRGAEQGIYAFPGRQLSHDNNSVPVESRLFVGTCLMARGPVVVQYATEFDPPPARRYVRMTEVIDGALRDTTLMEPETSLTATLAAVRSGACSEVPPRDSYASP